jgi:hypothetical protein
MPFDPDVFGNATRPKWSNASRSRQATSAHSTIVAGGPGSRSNASTVGCFGLAAGASGVCISRSARLASQTTVARSSTTQYSISRPLWRDHTPAVRTQSGRWRGHCFS